MSDSTPQARVSALEAHLGYWLRYVSSQASHAFSLKLAEQGVTVAEFTLLSELAAHEPLAPTVLAARMGMTRGAISKLVDRLEAKLLIVRWRDVTDMRRQDLNLTVQGRQMVPSLAALADDNDEQFFGQLDPEEREAIRQAMMRIVRQSGLKASAVD